MGDADNVIQIVGGEPDGSLGDILRLAAGATAGRLYQGWPRRDAQDWRHPNAGKVGKEMGLVVTDETSHWADEDLKAVADYLLDIN